MNVQICPTSPYKEIGKVVQARRKALGLSLTDLAKAAGVSRWSVRRLEAGVRMQVDYLEMVAYEQVLGDLNFSKNHKRDWQELDS